MRYQRLAQKLFCVALDLIDILGEFYAACLAAAAGMDLCLDHNDIGADLLGILYRFLNAEGGKPLGYSHTIGLQDLLALVLMDIHSLASL